MIEGASQIQSQSPSQSHEQLQGPSQGQSQGQSQSLPSGPGVAAATVDPVDSVRHELASVGLAASVRRTGRRYTAAGVTARLQLGRLLDASDPIDRGLSSVYVALLAGIPVTVTIVDPFGVAASDGLARFRRQFFAFLESATVDRSLLGLCLSAAEVPAPDFRARIRGRLGAGPRYVIVHGDAASPADETGNDAVWDLLRQSLDGPAPLWPAFPAGVRSHCPLLAGESSGSLLPDRGISVPSGTAWLPIELDVCRFTDAAGTIDHQALDRAVDACVDHGDRLIDHVTWFDDRQRRDAHLNRRLAVCVTGIGDLVERRRAAPGDLACLRDVDQLVAHIHEGLWHRSKRLAEARGAAPALGEHQANGIWRDETHRQDWVRRWRRALASVQVRNRNLLVLSPYSVLPRAVKAAPAYADLLPALQHADALSFAGPPPLTHWKLSEFKSFYLRVQALVERRNAASFVAAGV